MNGQVFGFKSMRKLPKKRDLSRVSELFRLLSEPTRLKILYSMLETEAQVGEIARLADMSVSAISHQLKLLREKRLVKSRRDGRRVFYSLDDYHIPALLALAGEHSQEDDS